MEYSLSNRVMQNNFVQHIWPILEMKVSLLLADPETVVPPKLNYLLSYCIILAFFANGNFYLNTKLESMS